MTILIVAVKSVDLTSMRQISFFKLFIIMLPNSPITEFPATMKPIWTLATLKAGRSETANCRKQGVNFPYRC